jgi:hypothetical protein
MTSSRHESWSAEKIVNIQKLGNILRVEIVNHPKKAVVFGLLAAVGLYIWIPMFWRWANKTKEDRLPQAGTQTAVSAAEAHDNSAGNSPVGKESKPSRFKWKEIVKRMDADPRTRPAEPLAATRDPFQRPREEIDRLEQEEKQAKVKPPVATPASLGMVLSSTLIGPAGQLARIGGKMYRRGQAIEMEREGNKYIFVLSEVHDGRVVLECEGERFDLFIPKPGSSGHMVLETVVKKTGR